jgi:transcriptional repressor of cell division inhibition gene dicB
MKKAQALELFDGDVQALAEYLGISDKAIYQWGEFVPRGTAYRLQVMTAGKLRVDERGYVKPRERA